MKALVIIRDSVAIIAAALGIIASTISIAASFGVTPDMIGEQAYEIFRAILPFFTLACGFLTGWNTKKAVFEIKKKCRFEGMSCDEARAALASLDAGGMVSARGHDAMLRATVGSETGLFVCDTTPTECIGGGSMHSLKHAWSKYLLKRRDKLEMIARSGSARSNER
ncbi:MAG: hypothetical protein RSB98_00965 [Raoultibacter sp.]